MGREARQNPMARDFAGFSPDKPPPPIKLGAQLDAQIFPSMGWLAENRREILRAQEAKEPLPQCPPEHSVVRIVIVGQVMIPKVAAKDYRDYPYGDAPVAVIHEMPWPQYRDLVVQQNPHLEKELGALGAEIVKSDG